jgi:hypothetical protein
MEPIASRHVFTRKVRHHGIKSGEIPYHKPILPAIMFLHDTVLNDLKNQVRFLDRSAVSLVQAPTIGIYYLGAI